MNTMAQGRLEAAIYEATSRFERARNTLVLDQFQLGALATSLKLLADPRCKTAWVDGRSLGFNPRFVLTLTPKALVALVAHEVLHVALGHPWRRGARDHHRWNIACDKVINTLLREFGFVLPAGAYYAEGNEIGQSAEWIYDHMPFDQPKDQPEGQPKAEEGEEGEEGEEDDSEGEGEPDESEDESEDKSEEEGEGESEEEGESDESESDEDGEPDEGESEEGEGDGEPDESEEGEGSGEPGNDLGEVRDAPLDGDADGDGPPSEDEWKERLAQTVSLAKGQGLEIGPAMARAVEQVMQPRVDVYSHVLRFFQEQSKNKYDWLKFNPRYAASGFFIAKKAGNEMGEVAIAIDTSGSIDQVALSKAASIVQEVLDEVEPLGVTMYFADDQVCHVQRLERGDNLIWEPRGGMGTDFRPVLDAIEQDDNQPICTIFITDLAGIFPSREPDTPVLWLATTQDQAPFGETVYIGW